MTMEVISIKPILALAVPLVCAFLVLVFRNRPNVREGCTLTAGLMGFLVILSMAPDVLGNLRPSTPVFVIAQGINLGFRADAFGLVFALTASFLWILVSVYAMGYMRSLKEHAQTRFYFFFALAIACALGIALARNLITFYLFYEALTFSTYWLVAHNEDEAAFAGARKYLVYLLISGWFFFAAVVMTFALTGTTEFVPGGILSQGAVSDNIYIILFILFSLGAMKAAWMPFHAWLPGAMVAPTPVSGLLHAVAVVKAGVFAFVRVVCYVFGLDLFQALGLGLVLAIMASFTMLTASFFAISEDNLKRRLAYSTVSQLSYILFGLALLTPFGIKGAMVHIPFHGFMKITLFLCAGAILVVTGKKQISQMAGMGRRMPITMTAFAVGGAGMCGLPPVAGFLSKYFLCMGTVQAGAWVLLGVILTSSVLDVIYFFPIVNQAFFQRAGPDAGSGPVTGKNRQTKTWEEIKEPLYLFMVIPLSITAIFSLVFFFFPNTFYILSLVTLAVQELFV